MDSHSCFHLPIALCRETIPCAEDPARSRSDFPFLVRGAQLLLLIFSLGLFVAADAAGKKPADRNRVRTEEFKPEVIALGPNPTLRFPVACLTGWSIKSTSYGWLEITRKEIRYTVVEPKGKMDEGFDMPKTSMVGLIHEQFVVKFQALGEKKKSHVWIYMPQGEWGSIHSGPGFGSACQRNAVGTTSLAAGLMAFDSSVARFLKPLIQKGDLDRLQALLKDNPDLALFRDREALTPLHWAVQFGRKDVAEWLLANRADVNAQANDGRTPLHIAAQEGHQDVAEVLLAHQADVNACAKKGNTPLYTAVAAGQNEVAELLLANHGDPNLPDSEGTTPLLLAAAANKKDAVAMLLAHHADVNARNNRGETALHLAMAQQYTEIASLLSASGGENETTPLTLFQDAARKNDLAQVQALVKDHPELIASVDRAGQTGLHLAAASGSKEVAAFLLDNKAEVDARDMDSRTPLSLAAQEGQVLVADLLLAHGADVNAKDKGGRTPRQSAAVRQQIDMAEWLREHGGLPLAQFSGIRRLDPRLADSLDKIEILPVVDGRTEQSVKVDLELVRKYAQKDLEWRHYEVEQADSPPAGARWMMVITLAAIGNRGPAPYATVYGTLYDRQNRTVVWQDMGGGAYESAGKLDQPTGNLNQALMQATSAQLTDITFLTLFRGEARKEALGNSLGAMMSGIPRLPKKKH